MDTCNANEVKRPSCMELQSTSKMARGLAIAVDLLNPPNIAKHQRDFYLLPVGRSCQVQKSSARTCL